MKPLVYLAVNSPLFAPVVLACLDKNRQPSKFEIRVASPPKAVSSAADLIDPLISTVLSRVDAARRLVIGVGDPMRLAAVPVRAEEAALERPNVVGVLLRKMCYWIVDGADNFGAGAHWADGFSTVLVHPPGMTGYTVTLHDIVGARNGLSGSDFERTVHQKLRYKDVDPSSERPLYDRLRKESNPAASVAFVTANPFYASEGSKSDSDLKVIYNFAHQKKFQNVAMTGLIVAERHGRDELEEVVGRLWFAVKFLLHDPLHAAYDLWKAFETNPELVQGGAPWFGLDRPAQLAETLVYLRGLGVYNEDAYLRIQRDHLEQTIRIRDEVVGMLPDTHTRQSSREIGGKFVCLA